MKLPEGWVIYSIAPEDCIVLYCENVGYVTIDMKTRYFAVGFGRPKWPNKEVYEGRGWKDRIVKDAVDFAEKFVGKSNG